MASYSGRFQCEGCKGTRDSSGWLYMRCCCRIIHTACWDQVFRTGNHKTPCPGCQVLVKRTECVRYVETMPNAEHTEVEADYKRLTECTDKLAKKEIELVVVHEKLLLFEAETGLLKTRNAFLEGQLSDTMATLDSTERAAASNAAEAAREKAQLDKDLRASEENLGKEQAQATTAMRALLHRERYPSEAKKEMSVTEIARMLEAGVASKEITMFAEVLSERNKENEHLERQLAARDAELAACQKELLDLKMLMGSGNNAGRSVAPNFDNMAQAGSCNPFLRKKQKLAAPE